MNDDQLETIRKRAEDAQSEITGMGNGGYINLTMYKRDMGLFAGDVLALMAELAQARETNDQLVALLEDTSHVVCAYVIDNPIIIHRANGQPQDPNGAHRLLTVIEAALVTHDALNPPEP